MENLSHSKLVSLIKKADESIAELVGRYNRTLSDVTAQFQSGKLVIEGQGTIYDVMRRAEARFNQDLEKAIQEVIGRALQADNPPPTFKEPTVPQESPPEEASGTTPPQRIPTTRIPRLFAQESEVLRNLGDEMPGIFGEDVIANAERERPLNP